MISRFFLCLILFVGASAQAKSAKQPIKAQIGIGYFYSEGEYQDRDTLTLKSLPFFLTLKKGLTSFKISSNYYRFIRKDSETSKSRSLNAWGNYYFSSKQLFKISHFLDYFDIESKIKLPVSNAPNGVGTSGFDFKLSSTAYYGISKNWFTASLAYRWRGSELRDTYSASFGFSRVFSKKTSAGGRLSYEPTTQKLSNAKIESTLHFTWKVHPKTSYSLYCIKGFDDQKLNWAGGFQFAYTL